MRGAAEERVARVTQQPCYGARNLPHSCRSFCETGTSASMSLTVQRTGFSAAGRAKSIPGSYAETPHPFLQVRARARELNLHGKRADGSLVEGLDVHIHFPAGAVPKDGPSAGVTMATALVSLLR